MEEFSGSLHTIVFNIVSCSVLHCKKGYENPIYLKKNFTKSEGLNQVKKSSVIIYQYPHHFSKYSGNPNTITPDTINSRKRLSEDKTNSLISIEIEKLFDVFKIKKTQIKYTKE